jgi:hypothetical protein
MFLTSSFINVAIKHCHINKIFYSPARLRLEAIASPVAGTNAGADFLYHNGRRGKQVPRKRQNGAPKCCLMSECKALSAFAIVSRQARRPIASGCNPPQADCQQRHAAAR